MGIGVNLIPAHAEHDGPRHPFDGVLAALPDEAVLLALVRPQLEFEDEPVVDPGGIGDAEFGPDALLDLDAPIVVRGSHVERLIP